MARPKRDVVDEVRHENKEGRKPRKKGSLGTQKQKLGFKIPEGKVGRIVNGTLTKDPGRLHAFQEAGYRFATYKDIGCTDDLASSASDLGSNVTVKVGTNKDGSEIVGYLMITDQDWYDEDQEIKQAEVDKTDSRIRNGDIGNDVERSKRYQSVKYEP